jgi:adenine/guanine/hypoxanthine permease
MTVNCNNTPLKREQMFNRTKHRLQSLAKQHAIPKQWGTEIISGLSTFLAMAYTLFITPTLLHQAGIPTPQAFFTTCCATIIGCLLMGFWGRLPFATGTSIALLIGFAHTVGHAHLITLAEMLAIIVGAHLIYLALQLMNIRDWLMKHMPSTLQKATTTGIAFLIVTTALQLANIVHRGPDNTLIINSAHAIGFITTLGLLQLSQRVMPRIYFLAVMLFMGWFTEQFMPGLARSLPSMTHSSLKWYGLDWSVFLHLYGWMMMLSIVSINLMDTTFVMELLGQSAGLATQGKHAQHIKRGLMSIGLVNILCAPFGASTQNTYFENIAGIKAGGKTGLSACVVAILFALSLFIYPYLSWIPITSVAAGLFFISMNMLHQCLKQCDFLTRCARWTTCLTVVLMPLTHSIITGLALGGLCYACFDLSNKNHWKQWQPHYAIYLFLLAYLACIALSPSMP